MKKNNWNYKVIMVGDLNEKHIPIDGESEVLDEDKKPLKQFIGIRKKRDAKKLINVLINEPWCYLHIDLN